MKNSKKNLFVGLTIIIGAVILYYVVDFAVYIYTSVQAINAEVAQRSDYTKITTPLPSSIVTDLCIKFNINPTDRRCLQGAVVYGPDFFDDIVSYFNKLPEDKRTYQAVQDQLGAYLMSCDKPDSKGQHICRYDLRGDRIYPIGFFFTRDGHLYNIIAIVGGS